LGIFFHQEEGRGLYSGGGNSQRAKKGKSQRPIKKERRGEKSTAESIQIVTLFPSHEIGGRREKNKGEISAFEKRTSESAKQLGAALATGTA